MLWLTSRKLFPLAPAVPSFFYTPTVAQPQHVALLLTQNVCVCFHSSAQTVSVRISVSLCAFAHMRVKRLCVSKTHNQLLRLQVIL